MTPPLSEMDRLYIRFRAAFKRWVERFPIGESRNLDLKKWLWAPGDHEIYGLTPDDIAVLGFRALNYDDDLHHFAIIRPIDHFLHWQVTRADS